MSTRLAFILLLLVLSIGSGFSNGPKTISLLSGDPADSNGAFDGQTVYRIELLVSKEPIYLAPANFKGLENVEEHYENGMFFYTSGYSLDYSYARDVLLNQIKHLGYKAPNIIALRNNKKTPLDTVSHDNDSSVYFLIEPDGSIEYLRAELEADDTVSAMSDNRYMSSVLPADTGLNPTFSIGGGAFSYFGDLKPFDSMGRVGDNMGFDLSISSKLNKYLTGGLVFLKGKITTDERSETRNLNFQSRLTAGGLFVSHNLSNWIDQKSRLKPYVTLGIEAFEFNSKGDLLDANGNTYFYWSDGSIRIEPETGTNPNALTTSRDYVYESDLREADLDGLGKYPQFSLAIPVGVGITFDITDHLGFKASTTMHLTFTDLLDDVSEKGDMAREGKDNLEKFLYTSFSLQYKLFDKKKPIEPQEDSLMLAIADTLPEDTTGEDVIDSTWASGSLEREITNPGSDDKDTSLRVLPFNQDSIDMFKPGDFDLNAKSTKDSLANEEVLYGPDTDTSLRVLPFNQDSIDMAQFVDLELNSKDETAKDINEYDLSTIIRNDSIWALNLERIDPVIKENNDQVAKQDSIWQILLGIFPKGEYPSQEFENKILSIPGVKSKVVNDTVFYTAPTTSVNDATIVFRIQLGAFSKQIPIDFFKLNDVIMIPGKDGLFKYLSGEFNDYLDARKHRKKMIANGFEDAFIAVFSAGQRISVSEAGIPLDQVEQIDKQEEEEVANEVIFKIQIHASKNPVYNAPLNFKGLENVNEYFDNGLYKYTVDVTKDFGYAMDVLLPNTRKLGFKDAFVVAFQKGKRLTRNEVVRYLNQR